MKNYRFVHLYTTLAALMVAAIVFAPVIHAADKAETAAAKKARQEQENLEKYDKNHDGKLDNDEKAELKADQAKATAEKKAAAAEKKEAAAEKKREREAAKKTGEK
jgi:flagellar biosynthesis/type III secretory pathway M-ring protein FliF/YscJ